MNGPYAAAPSAAAGRRKNGKRSIRTMRYRPPGCDHSVSVSGTMPINWITRKAKETGLVLGFKYKFPILE